MKKNIIIGELSTLLLIMTLTSYVQKIQAEEAQKMAIEYKIRAEEQMAIAQEAQEAQEIASKENN